jgi:hypothetical protein
LMLKIHFSISKTKINNDYFMLIFSNLRARRVGNT